MPRTGRVGLAAGLAVSGPLLFAAAWVGMPPAALAGHSAAEGHSLFFSGSGTETADIVRVTVDDPANGNAGPPADIGADPFTIELWMRGKASDNGEPEVYCGANEVWLAGHVIVDRDRVSASQSFGLSVANGIVVFGVSTEGGNRTICGTTQVLNDQWHHVAAEYRPSDGKMWLFVDGNFDATGSVTPGDVSYPDGAVPALHCGGPCTSDTYLAFGSAKRNENPSFRGYLDEIRLSSMIRYTSSFTPRTTPFVTDAQTAALYHLEEGSGTTVTDSSDAAGGPSNGVRLTDATGYPAWRTESPFRAAAAPAGGPTGGPRVGGGGGPASGSSGGGLGSGTASGGGSSGGLDSGSGGGGSAISTAAPGEDPLAQPQAGGQARRVAKPRSSRGDGAIPPIAIALIGLGIAVFLAARFLRSDHIERV